jgi:hypothetical protein
MPGKIDFRRFSRWLRRVRVVSNRLAVVFLLAVWLAATQHCGLEAAGLFATHTEEGAAGGCCKSSDVGCEIDGCDTVEKGEYRSDARGAKVAAPELAECLALICSTVLNAYPPSDTRVIERIRSKASLDWVPTWQFERRAAAPAHAPDSLIA